VLNDLARGLEVIYWPWYRCMSLLLPCATPELVKLPQNTITLGMKLFSMQLSKIFCRPFNVSAWSSHTSEKKKKFIPEKSRWIRVAY